MLSLAECPVTSIPKVKPDDMVSKAGIRLVLIMSAKIFLNSQVSSLEFLASFIRKWQFKTCKTNTRKDLLHSGAST